jgi:outer membrane protein
VRGSGGIFDPYLTAGVNGDSTQSPTSTILEGANVAQSRNTRFLLGVDQLLPSGTQLGGDWTSFRGETNSTFFFLNPRWDASLNLTLTQPLLNGFGTTVTRSQIIIAENLQQQTAVGFEVQVIQLLADVEQAYWELVAARQQVSVSEQSLALAQRLLEETQQRVDVGTSAPIDMVQSEATVANRQQELIYVKNASANAEDNLKALLGFNLPHEWQVKIEATDSYEMDPVLPDLQKSIETALEKRPSIIRQELELARLDHNVQVARNGALPQLNLTGSYGWSGVSGTSTIEDPDTGEPVTIRQGWGDAATQVFNFDYPKWTLGLTYSVPIGNHRAKEQLAATRYQRDRADTQLAALKQSITHEVRIAVRALYDGSAAIDAAPCATSKPSRPSSTTASPPTSRSPRSSAPSPMPSTPRSGPASTTARRWPGTTPSPAPTSSRSASRSTTAASPSRSTISGRTPSGCSSRTFTAPATTSRFRPSRWRRRRINSRF